MACITMRILPEDSPLRKQWRISKWISFEEKPQQKQKKVSSEKRKI